MENNIEIEAGLDEGMLGYDRVHFVFPATPKDPFKRAAYPEVTGGIYFKKGTPLPKTVTIVIQGDDDAEIHPTK